jgi:hypothetical protein
VLHDDIDEPENKKPQAVAPTTAITVLDNGPQVEALTNQGKELKETVNILICQIQGLRSEVRQKK